MLNRKEIKPAWVWNNAISKKQVAAVIEVFFDNSLLAIPFPSNSLEFAIGAFANWQTSKLPFETLYYKNFSFIEFQPTCTQVYCRFYNSYVPNCCTIHKDISLCDIAEDKDLQPWMK